MDNYDTSSLLGIEKNMFLTQINKNIVIVIKFISTVLIFSAIGLEIWNLYAALTEQKILSSLNPIFWVGRFVIVMHLIEVIIAFFYAPLTKKISIKYGVYIFLVGTVGLLELFEGNEKISPHDIN